LPNLSVCDACVKKEFTSVLLKSGISAFFSLFLLLDRRPWLAMHIAQHAQQRQATLGTDGLPVVIHAALFAQVLATLVAFADGIGRRVVTAFHT
jgi:hypothetical protein